MHAATKTTTTMKALVIYDRVYRVGNVSQALDLAEVPRQPVPLKPSHLLVKVYAASLSIEDLYTAIGRRPLLSITPTPSQPVTLGIEFTGEIAEIGEGESRYKIGDKVMGMMTPVRVKHGCWAQNVSVHVNNVTMVPENWTMQQAASFGMSSLVAQAAACCIQEPYSQKRVAIVGASGGIGSLLVTLLASRGMYVVGVCSASNADFVKSCGAREICTRESGGLATYRISDDARTDKAPLDYVVDCVGGDRIEQDAAKALRKFGKGHFITVVGPGDEPFGGSDATGGVGRGAFIAAKALKAKWSSGHSYTLASMKPFGIGNKLTSVAQEINEYTNGKGPNVRTRTIAANDMTAVRAAMDDVSRHFSDGRIILDFGVFDLNESDAIC